MYDVRLFYGALNITRLRELTVRGVPVGSATSVFVIRHYIVYGAPCLRKVAALSFARRDSSKQAAARACSALRRVVIPRNVLEGKCRGKTRALCMNNKLSWSFDD